ncbi:AAA family ATPase [Micromonospora sp. WMMD882]|uniref:AAA family ATPase n=1 Tax=Micromonospora sp. WMMD882 TaxID=3015151 RepID=UPI00248BA776|nr:AAA family ATPase [Micromonospora sp. WMMD882]WBB78619.1 AAA family ATPase [Micromonospora sp. WMMD882]
MWDAPSIVLITGIMAAGKSTVAELLARRLPRSAHLRGDVFRRMVVGGRAEMTADPSPEAWRQLRLRHQLTASTADAYAGAGFTVVCQDVILGAELPAMVDRIRRRPLAVVVLAPRPEVVAAREAGRAKQGYGEWSVAELDAGFRADTPRIGLWLDTSDQTPEQTVTEILTRAWSAGRIG